jgi:cation:H+ antiporter
VADSLILLAGMVVLVLSGEGLVRGATGLAQSYRVSPLAIGLTVVALGTSAPELAVNVSAALSGSTSISFGNVIGSNLANMGLVVGVIALIRPVAIQTSVVRREIPMMLLATGVALVLGADVWLAAPPNIYTRGDALALLLLFCVFLYYVLADVRSQRGVDSYLEEVVQSTTRLQRSLRIPMGPVILIAVGVIGLVVGAELTVTGATGLATALGVSDTLIGLTLVAVGTSLPELTASVVAALRGHTDLAVGNVVGSNILNLCLVLGATGTLAPIPVPDGGIVDLIAATLFSLLLLGVCTTYRHQIMRGEGVLLLAGYLLYIGQRVLFWA